MSIESLNAIDPRVLKEFIAAGNVKSALIRAIKNRLIVVLKIGETERILGQYRGGIRFFRSFDGAVAVLQQNGILTWSADTTGWIPRTIRKKYTKNNK